MEREILTIFSIVFYILANNSDGFLSPSPKERKNKEKKKRILFITRRRKKYDCLIDGKLSFSKKNVSYVVLERYLLCIFIFTRCPFLNLIEGFLSEHHILRTFMICFVCVMAEFLTGKCMFDF